MILWNKFFWPCYKHLLPKWTIYLWNNCGSFRSIDKWAQHFCPLWQKESMMFFNYLISHQYCWAFYGKKLRRYVIRILCALSCSYISGLVQWTLLRIFDKNSQQNRENDTTIIQTRSKVDYLLRFRIIFVLHFHTSD